MTNDCFFGLNIEIRRDPLGFRYGEGVVGPVAELRTLNSMRRSLRDPLCTGPDPVYAIAMDVRKKIHEQALQQKRLLFGIVAYAAGRLGEEPVRSQGHVHRPVAGSGWSPPEVFEVWRGRGVVLMQEATEADPGRCFAVEGKPGDLIVAPPGWAHAVISADPSEPLVFGAWCHRSYGFVYDAIRRSAGLAWYPLAGAGAALRWCPNPAYQRRELIRKRPRSYPELGLTGGRPLYTLFEKDPEKLAWVSSPELTARVWEGFVP